MPPNHKASNASPLKIKPSNMDSGGKYRAIATVLGMVKQKKPKPHQIALFNSPLYNCPQPGRAADINMAINGCRAGFELVCIEFVKAYHIKSSGILKSAYGSSASTACVSVLPVFKTSTHVTSRCIIFSAICLGTSS